MNTIKKVLVAMGLVLAAQGIAQAGPIVPVFNYTVVTEFLSATYTNGTGTPGGFQPAGTSTTSTLLSWGIPATTTGQSSLGITNPAPGTVTTIVGNAPPVPDNIAIASTVTHDNHPVFAPTLLTTTLRGTLTLNNPNPPAGPGTLPPLSFDVAFTETTNAEPCASNSPGNPCNDIFVLVDASALSQSFSLDGNTYFVDVFPALGSTLGQLTAAECAAAGQAAGCTGFTTPTPENAVTNLPFVFTVKMMPVKVEPVPEPGSLALMGLGLMGFAVARRKPNRLGTLPVTG
jgi:hypothetical protein